MIKFPFGFTLRIKDRNKLWDPLYLHEMVNHDQFYNTHLSYSRHHGPCLAKLDLTSTRNNAARCQSEGFSKYGGSCVKHNALPQGRHY